MGKTADVICRSLWLQANAKPAQETLHKLCKHLADESANSLTLAQAAALAFMDTGRTAHPAVEGSVGCPAVHLGFELTRLSHSPPVDLSDGLTLLCHLTLQHIRMAIEAGDFSAPLLQGWSVCCRASRWMGKIDPDDTTTARPAELSSVVLREILRVDGIPPEQAVAVLEMLAAEQEQATSSASSSLHWLAVFMTLRTRLGPDAEQALGAVFASVVGNVAAEVYGLLLSSTIEHLAASSAPGGGQPALLLALLSTLRLLLSLDITGAGKIVRANIQPALSAVSWAVARATAVEVVEACIAVLDALVSTRVCSLCA